LVPYSLTLSDFTGDYRKSGRLRISENVNASLVVIHSEPWFFNTITSPMLRNGSDYMIEIYVPGFESINYGWIIVNGASSLPLTATRPVLTDSVNHYAGLQFRPIYDYSLGVVGFSYNVTQGTVNSVVFNVRNQSNNTLLYSSTLYTNSGSFLQSVPVNQSYVIELVMDVQNHSVLSFGIPVSLDNGKVLASGLNLPDLTALGVSSSKAKAFAVFAVLTATAFMASPATAGYIALAILGETILFYMVGFLGAAWPYVLVGGLLAFAIKIGIDRKFGGD